MSYGAFRAPDASWLLTMASKADAWEPVMISPYLERPMRPLAATLSAMLEKIETELTDEKLGAAEKWQRRMRAGLIRSLLTPGWSPSPPRSRAGPPARILLFRLRRTGRRWWCPAR